jgi:hypothetical protein
VARTGPGQKAVSASRLLMATSGTRMPEFMGSPLDKIYEGRAAGRIRFYAGTSALMWVLVKVV